MSDLLPHDIAYEIAGRLDDFINSDGDSFTAETPTNLNDPSVMWISHGEQRFRVTIIEA